MAFFRRVRVVNKVDELIETLSESFDRDAIESTLEETARLEAARFQNILRQVAPKGQVEPVINYRGFTRSESRPSLRQHGVTLEDGWRQPEIIKTPKGVHFRLVNIAPHLPILLRGAKPHPIPLSIISGNTLLFHWGSPLRWAAKDGRGPGPRVFLGVNHPGFKAVNFIENALSRKEGRETIKSSFDRTFKKLLNPLETIFNK